MIKWINKENLITVYFYTNIHDICVESLYFVH